MWSLSKLGGLKKAPMSIHVFVGHANFSWLCSYEVSDSNAPNSFSSIVEISDQIKPYDFLI